MAYPSYVRAKARELRASKCLTIDEIAERLALPRTTIFYWVRDLPRSRIDSSKASAARRRAVESTRAKHRLLRERAYSEGCDHLRVTREIETVSRSATRIRP